MADRIANEGSLAVGNTAVEFAQMIGAEAGKLARAHPAGRGFAQNSAPLHAEAANGKSINEHRFDVAGPMRRPGTPEVRVFSPSAMHSSLEALAAAHRDASGVIVSLAFEIAPAFRKRLEAGEKADVLIAPPGVMDELVQIGKARAQERIESARSCRRRGAHRCARAGCVQQGGARAFAARCGIGRVQLCLERHVR